MFVYEPSNNVCESVVTTRTAYFGITDDRSLDWPILFNQEYSLDVVETSPLSCCLAAEDYQKNIDACEEDKIWS